MTLERIRSCGLWAMGLMLLSCGDGGRDPRFDAFAKALQADLAASEAYGVSAAVMESGVVTFAVAFGSKDQNGALPLTPHTLMQIGSTTKQMTAAALLRKVEDGDLALDDKLEVALPEFEFALDSTWDDQISVRHLLTHQGAFRDGVPWNRSADDADLVGYTYGIFKDEIYLMNPPGAFWNYSNPNFIIAGLLTEVSDTRAWPDIMMEDVFKPLGMDRTFPRKSEVEADGDYALSYGYGVDDLSTGQTGPVSMADMPDPAWGRPAGFVWTTPTQMLTWARFLMEGNPDVLADDLRTEITTPQVDTLYGMGTMHYGYGEFVESGYYAKDGSWYPTTVWEHGGNTLSFSHLFYVLPEARFAISICSSGLTTDFSRALNVALTTLADLPAPIPGWKYTVDPAEFENHVGNYFDPYNVGEVIVTREGDQLLIDAPRLTAAGYTVTPELMAISSDLFVVTVDDGSGATELDLTFIPRAGEKQSTYIRNRAFVATRVEDSKSSKSTATRPRPSREQIRRFWIRSRLMEGPARIAPPR